MNQKEIGEFQKEIYAHYKKNGRNFPWRAPALKLRKDGSIDPYKVMVSEIMLQQTQTARVIEKFKAFTKKFPNVQKLSEASLADVLIEWQGLGYNRRGKALHDAAKMIVSEFGGNVPRTKAELVSLSGIGPYTAGAVRAFAFNEPEVFIETNIRTVYLYHFFETREQTVHDEELLPLIEKTMDADKPRDWYSALMDYGAALKEQGIKLNNKSRHYTKQSKFEGSDRQIRGAILRALAQEGNLPTQKMNTILKSDPQRIKEQLTKLQKDNMIIRKDRMWGLAE